MGSFRFNDQLKRGMALQCVGFVFFWLALDDARILFASTMACGTFSREQPHIITGSCFRQKEEDPVVQ